MFVWTVTGSLLFGSPHRPVRGYSRSTSLCLLRFDVLDGIPVSGWRTNVRQQGIHAHLLVTLNSRFTPDIITSGLIDTESGSSFRGACVVARWEIYIVGHDRSEICRCRQCLIHPGNLVWIVLVMFYLSYCLVAGGPATRNIFRSCIGPSGTVPFIVKVMSVPDSRCIRVVTPDDHVNIAFHEVLLHDMEAEDLPFVALTELDCLRRIWPKTLFVFMSRYQHDLERMRKECK